jgi:hypothetical protein
VGSCFKEFIARNTMVQCNRILIMILGLEDMAFFNLKKYGICVDVSNFGF